MTSLDRLSLVGLACLHFASLAQVFNRPAELWLVSCTHFRIEAMEHPNTAGAIKSYTIKLVCLLITWPLMMDWRYRWYPLYKVLAMHISLRRMAEPLYTH